MARLQAAENASTDDADDADHEGISPEAATITLVNQPGAAE